MEEDKILDTLRELGYTGIGGLVSAYWCGLITRIEYERCRAYRYSVWVAL